MHIISSYLEHQDLKKMRLFLSSYFACHRRKKSVYIFCDFKRLDTFIKKTTSIFDVWTPLVKRYFKNKFIQFLDVWTPLVKKLNHNFLLFYSHGQECECEFNQICHYFVNCGEYKLLNKLHTF